MPDTALYFLGGAVAQVVERGLTFLPAMIIVSKATPPGIEATMCALAVTLLILNQFILRSVMGVLINDNFIFVSKGQIDDYMYLKMVCIVAAVIPLSYMWRLVPTAEETDELHQSHAQQRGE